MHRIGVMRARLLAGLVLGLSVASACGDPAPSSPPTVDGPVSVAVEELRYTCATFPFDPVQVAGPGGAEQGPEPLAVALRAILAGGDHGGFLPERGWHLAGEDGQTAEFVAPKGSTAWST